jgi:protease I
MVSSFGRTGRPAPLPRIRRHQTTGASHVRTTADIRNAGGTWVDAEVQVCTAGPNVLVTSRKPDDLPAFCNELRTAFAKA